jgi:hypothetical protein
MVHNEPMGPIGLYGNSALRIVIVTKTQHAGPCRPRQETMETVMCCHGLDGPGSKPGRETFSLLHTHSVLTGSRA